jgi:hypothetical protein
MGSIFQGQFFLLKRNPESKTFILNRPTTVFSNMWSFRKVTDVSDKHAVFI